MKLSVTAFSGIAPKQNPRYLQDTQAQEAMDCSVNTGPLRPLANTAPLAGVSVPSGSLSIYRFGQDAPETQTWLSWPQDVDVARGLVNDDATERTYFTGTDKPRVTDSTMVPGSRMLGVPTPTVAPDVSAGVFLPKRMPAEVYISSAELDQMELSMGIAFSGTVIDVGATTVVRAFPLTRSVVDVSRAINEQIPNVVAEVSGTGVLVKADEAHSGTEFGLVVNVAGNFDNTLESAGADGTAKTTYNVTYTEGAQPIGLSMDDVKYMSFKAYREVFPNGYETMEYEYQGTHTPWIKIQRTPGSAWEDIMPETTMMSEYGQPYGTKQPAPWYHTTDINSPAALANTLRAYNLDASVNSENVCVVQGIHALKYRTFSPDAPHATQRLWVYRGWAGSVYGTQYKRSETDWEWDTPGPASPVEAVVEDVPAAPACATIPLSDLNASAPFGFYFSVDGGPRLLFPMPEPLAADNSNSVTIVGAINASGVKSYVDVSFDETTGLKLCSKTSGAGASIQVFLQDPTTSARLEGAGYEEDPGPKEARVYTYTFVNDWGEESAPYSIDPMPASCTVEVYAEQGALVGLPTSAPAEAHISKIRVYRSVVAQGTATYLYVGETNLGTSLFNDDKSADLLGEECPSVFWTPPKTSLKGLVSMPNGIMAGFDGYDVYFCEPFRPFAWPAIYSITVAYPIVGLGAIDTTLVVLTKGRPYFVQGSHPDSMVAVEADLLQACVSKRSIVSLDGVVYYASPDGMVAVAPNGSKVVTAGLFDKFQWQSLGPQNIHAYAQDGQYVGFFANGGFLFDPASGSFVLHGINATAGYTDLRNDTLYVLQGNSLGQWGEGTPRTYTWRSKEFTLPKPMSFSALRVGAESYPVTAEVRRDKALIHTVVVNDEQPVRLPAGLGLSYDMKVTANSDIYAIELGQSVTELTNAG